MVAGQPNLEWLALEQVPNQPIFAAIFLQVHRERRAPTGRQARSRSVPFRPNRCGLANAGFPQQYQAGVNVDGFEGSDLWIQLRAVGAVRIGQKSAVCKAVGAFAGTPKPLPRVHRHELAFCRVTSLNCARIISDSHGQTHVGSALASRLCLSGVRARCSRHGPAEGRSAARSDDRAPRGNLGPVFGF